jgi:hypothetical protein
MAADFYVHRNGQVTGPLTSAELKKLAREGGIQPDDLVQKEKDGKPIKAANVKGLLTALAATTAPTPETSEENSTSLIILSRTREGLSKAAVATGNLVQSVANKLRTREVVPAPIQTIEATPIAVPAAPQSQVIVPIEADDMATCPFCGEAIKKIAKKCKHCGEILDVMLRSVQAQQPTPHMYAQPVPQVAAQPVINITNVNTANAGGGGRRAIKRWSPFVAFLLSLLIPGLGQVYKGQALNGIVWFCVVLVGYAALIVPGLILHLCCVIGAASGDPYR